MPKFEEEEIVEVESAFDEHQELLKPIRVSYDNSTFKNTIINFKGKMDEQEKKEWIKKKILKNKIRQESPEKHNPEDHLKSILLHKYIQSENKKIDPKTLNLAHIESVPVEIFEGKYRPT